MEITTVKTGPKRHHIFLNNEFWKEVSTAIFGKRCKLPPVCDDVEEWKAAFAKREHEGARKFAAFLLSKRDYSTHSLKQKLKEHLASQAVCEGVIEELTERGYLNDEQYAEMLVRSCRNRGMGDGLIKTKLRAKGLSFDYLSSLEDPLEVARQAWEKIAKRHDLTDPKGKQRAIAAMARRGFDWPNIEQVSSI